MLHNYHTHSTFCDGKNPPEETVEYAISQGFGSLGFSGHGPTAFDMSYCMQDIPGYRNEILRLKEKYRDKIQIVLGVEEDMGDPVRREDFDYIIGSCHYFAVSGCYLPIDESREVLEDTVQRYFHGDVLLAAEDYYSRFSRYICSRKPDIVGHFDLLTKFDEGEHPLFSTVPGYREIALHYLDKSLESGCIFEVNTGAIARGYRKTPYPDVFLLERIREKGGKIMLSSDCHNKLFLDCHFRETGELLKHLGFRELYIWDRGAFRPQPIDSAIPN